MQYKKSHFQGIIGLIAVLFLFLIAACQGTESAETKRQACLQKVDSLWMAHQAIRAEFIFKMDEFNERKEQMEAILTQSKFMESKALTEENMNDIRQYNGIFRIYKDLGKRYKDMVLKGEDLFYEIKGLEDEVKHGNFDKNTQPFVQEYNHLTRELDEVLVEARSTASQLKGVEPVYMRVAPKVDALVENQ